MPSFTSNSNDRLPETTNFKAWILSLILASSVLLGVEAFWRQAGYQPTLVDDWPLWCTQRDQVKKLGRNSLLLLGHSRIHQAFVPEVFAEELPDQKYVQLGIFNSEPIPNLIDIAENTNFSGTIVCSVLCFSLLPEVWTRTEDDPYRDDLLRYYYEEWGMKNRADRLVRNFFQNRLALLSPDLKLHSALPDVAKGEWPQQWVYTDLDRTQFVDYDNTDLAAQTDRQMRWIKMIVDNRVKNDSYKNWPQKDAFKPINDAVDKIQNRGGHVIFLRTVTSGEFGTQLLELFPRDKFWDYFAENSRGTKIYFQDVPELANMECADGSHLFYKDALVFTRVLARELKKRGLLNPKEQSQN